MRVLVAIVLFAACAVNVASQQVSSQTRAQAIATAFNKQKHVLKAKHGVTREKFKDIRTEPDVKPNAAAYAGTYEMADLGYVITLQVGADGRIHGSGSEQGEQQTRTFKLQNAKIEGALLTAAKVYEDGTTEMFEGAFLSRTLRVSPAAPAIITSGLGVILARPFEVNGLTYDKLFFELRQ